MKYKQFIDKLSPYFSPSEICMIDKFYTDVAVDMITDNNYDTEDYAQFGRDLFIQECHKIPLEWIRDYAGGSIKNPLLLARDIASSAF